MPLDFSRITISVPLVSLDTAKDHLRVPDDDHDADISAKLEASQELIISKLGAAADPAWDETSAPRVVTHAILIALDALYERRGGDEANDALRKALQTIDLLLALYRDPSLA